MGAPKVQEGFAGSPELNLEGRVKLGQVGHALQTEGTAGADGGPDRAQRTPPVPSESQV